MKTWLKLFFTGFVQVYFVAINTVFLSKELYIGVFFAAFMISMVWSWNIKKIAFGSIKDRIFYSLGATAGSMLGLYSSSFILKLLS
jgi:hypothetical protein